MTATKYRAKSGRIEEFYQHTAAASAIGRVINLPLVEDMLRRANTQPGLLAALGGNASWLAFVLKGIKSGYIPDQTVLDTSGKGPVAGMTPLSEILTEQLSSARAALAAATPEKGE